MPLVLLQNTLPGSADAMQFVGKAADGLHMSFFIDHTLDWIIQCVQACEKSGCAAQVDLMVGTYNEGWSHLSTPIDPATGLPGAGWGAEVFRRIKALVDAIGGFKSVQKGGIVIPSWYDREPPRGYNGRVDGALWWDEYLAAAKSILAYTSLPVTMPIAPLNNYYHYWVVNPDTWGGKLPTNLCFGLDCVQPKADYDPPAKDDAFQDLGVLALMSNPVLPLSLEPRANADQYDIAAQRDTIMQMVRPQVKHIRFQPSWLRSGTWIRSGGDDL